MWLLPSPLLSSYPSLAEEGDGVFQPVGMADP